MKITILKEEKNLLEIELEGIDISLLEQLVDEMQSNADVEFVAYKRVHPLVSNPVLILKTKKKSPREHLSKVLDEMLKTWDDLLKEMSNL
jgi:DNA-directed RNA polymerase subunit L